MSRLACCGLCLIAVLSLPGAVAAAERKPMPDTAREYIIWPPDGRVIPGGKFWLRIGLHDAGVAPAGINKRFTGHHHVLVDTDLPPLDEPIPNDKTHLHFGKGQTEVRMVLPTGRHTLQLIFGDTDHVPHQPPLYSKRITVIVPGPHRPITVPPAAEEMRIAPATRAPAASRTPSPPGAYLYIGWPNEGTVVRSTYVRVWFGLRGMGVAPAGTEKPNTGHHHLLIDTDLPPPDQAIPNDRNHQHFGMGQTETVLELAPGKHTLQLLLGDSRHYTFDPPVVSKKITFYVRP